MYTNSDGLLNKMQELKNLVNSADRPDTIAITEYKPKNLAYPALSSEFNLEGCESFGMSASCQGSWCGLAWVLSMTIQQKNKHR